LSICFDIFGRRATSAQKFVGQSSKRKQVMRDQISKFGPDYLETDELWSTYCDTLGKPSGRATTTRPPKFVGQSSKMVEISHRGQKTENPHFCQNLQKFQILNPRSRE